MAVSWVEDRSQITREDAERSAGLLRAAGVGRIVVMHAVDVSHAREAFSRVGLQVVRAPTRLPRAEGIGAVVADFLPSAPALLIYFHYAIHELIAKALPLLHA